MLQHFTKYIVDQLVKNEIIKEESQEVYVYGLSLVCMTTLTMLTILLIGVICGQVNMTVIFLVSLTCLRHYTGGYHASSYGRCFCLSCFWYLCVLSMIILVEPRTTKLFWEIVMLVATAYIFKVAPLNSKKNPKTAEEMIQRRYYSYTFTSLFAVISLIIYFFNFSVEIVADTLVCTQAVVALSLFASQIQGRYFLWKSKKQC